MSFDSWSFAFFFAAVLLLHRVLPWRAGRVVLLAASYVFYGAGSPWHCLLLAATTVVNFTAALAIDSRERERTRKALLAAALMASLGLLAAFKYGAFFATSCNVMLSALGLPALPIPELALPIGISFYTFQALSYTLDVYYSKTRAGRDFTAFALYVAFFPQLVAGPIERASKLMPQLCVKRLPARSDFEAGFQRVLWGLAKKIVIADRFGLFADHVYGAPAEASASALLIGTACFAVQVYLDFSSYCDIAIGAARMLGISLSENFLWPMLSRNPVELWTRWHITLGTWFRDYLFTAIVGRRRPGPVRRIANLVLLMVLAGLWHGPAWHFVAFGLAAGLGVALYEGIYLVSGRPRSRPLFGAGPLSTIAAVALMNLFGLGLVVLFRAQSLADAGVVFAGVFRGPWDVDGVAIGYAAAAAVVWAVCIARGALFSDERREIPMPAALRAAFWLVLCVAILYGAVDTDQQFIYFQF